MLSRKLEFTLRRALDTARDRRHEFATLVHLLLSLLDDDDATELLRACAVDIEKLRIEVAEFLDEHLVHLRSELPGEPKAADSFQWIVQRAAIRCHSSGRELVTGADVLVGLFEKPDSHAVYFLHKHHLTELKATNFISGNTPGGA